MKIASLPGESRVLPRRLFALLHAKPEDRLVFRKVCLLLAVLGLAVLPLIGVPGELEGQNVIHGGPHNFSVPYEPGSATQNGYVDAELRMKYWLAECGSVALLIQAESYPHIVVRPHRYWVNGRLVQAPPHISAPQVTIKPAVRGTVRGRGIQKEVAHQHMALGADTPDCGYNNVPVADQKDLWKPGATEAEKTAALRDIAFHPTGRFPPLRNRALEDHFVALWRQEQRDSIARVEAEQKQAKAQREQEARRAAEAERQAAAEREERAAAERQASAQHRTDAARQAEEAKQAEAARQRSEELERRSAAANAEMMRRGQQLLADAEASFQNGSYDEARPLYEQVMNGPSVWEPYKATARQRLAYMADQQLVDATAEALTAIGSVIGPVVDRVFESLSENYPGFMVGAHVQSSAFAGALLGWSLGFHIEDTPVAPYVEMGFGLGGDEEQESVSMSFGGGMAVPKYGLQAGRFSLAPHVGYRFLGTSNAPLLEENRESGYRTRSLHLGTVGAMLVSRSVYGGTFLRLDLMYISGTPHLGGAWGLVF